MKGSAQKDFLREFGSVTGSMHKDVTRDLPMMKTDDGETPREESLGASLLRLVADLEIEEVGMAHDLSHEAVAARASLAPGACGHAESLGGADSFPSPFGHVRRGALGSGGAGAGAGAGAGGQRRPDEDGARNISVKNDGQHGQHERAGSGGVARGGGTALENSSLSHASNHHRGVGKGVAADNAAASVRNSEKEAGKGELGSLGRRSGSGLACDADTQSVLTEDGTQSLMEQVEQGAAAAAKHSPGHALRVAQRKPAREKLGI
jgi:hypothetical protein